jgi:hypothetical protein
MTMVKYMIDNTQEEGQEKKKLGFLYDIGCHIEKGINRVSHSKNCQPTPGIFILADQIHPIIESQAPTIS